MLPLVRFAATVLALVAAPPTFAQQKDDLDALNAQVEQLYRWGKYADANPLAERAVELALSKHGPDSVAAAATPDAAASARIKVFVVLLDQA